MFSILILLGRLDWHHTSSTLLLQHHCRKLVQALLVGTGLSQSVQGGKGGRRDSLRRLDKRGSQASLNGLPEGEPAASTSLQTSTSEREALLARLQGSEEKRGDLDQLLAASAKALQDAGEMLSQVLPSVTWKQTRPDRQAMSV